MAGSRLIPLLTSGGIAHSVPASFRGSSERDRHQRSPGPQAVALGSRGSLRLAHSGTPAFAYHGIPAGPNRQDSGRVGARSYAHDSKRAFNRPIDNRSEIGWWPGRSPQCLGWQRTLRRRLQPLPMPHRPTAEGLAETRRPRRLSSGSPRTCPARIRLAVSRERTRPDLQQSRHAQLIRISRVLGL